MCTQDWWEVVANVIYKYAWIDIVHSYSNPLDCNHVIGSIRIDIPFYLKSIDEACFFDWAQFLEV